MSRELLKRALEALTDAREVIGFDEYVVADIETYLAQPEPEPVAWRALNFAEHGGVYAYRDHDEPFVGVSGSNVGEPLYTTPPDQSARIAELTKRLRIAEDVIRTSKLTSDCKTADDWKHKAEWYEYNWRTCSEGFNAMASDLKSQLAALQSKRERLSDSRIVEVMGDRFPVETIAFYEGFRAAEKAHGIGEKS